MTFKEIAHRITGISVPVFGLSWNPTTPSIVIARKVVTYLEDRRVLFNPFELELPDRCIQSVIKIREFLTEQLFDVEMESHLSTHLRGMRSACRKFLNHIEQNEDYFHDRTDDSYKRDIGMGGQMILYSALGELRAALGMHIAHLVIMHGIDVESDLLRILPLAVEGE